MRKRFKILGALFLIAAIFITSAILFYNYKLDKQEIINQTKAYTNTEVIILGLLLLISAIIIIFLWRNSRLKFYKKEYEFEKEKNMLLKHYDYLSKYANDIILLTNDKGIIKQANEKALKVYGYTQEELYGLSSRFLRVPEQRDQFDELIKWVYNEEGTIYETIHIRKNGERFPVEVSLRSLEIEGIRFMQAIIRDISERKQIEKNLKISEELYRNLFENMLNGLAHCKMIYEDEKPVDFIYLQVNTEFESLTGLKNVVGKKVSEVIPGILESDKELIARYGRVALTGKPEIFEVNVQALNMWFSISVYSPEKEYFVAVFDVITARKLAETGLKRLSKAIEQSPVSVVITDPKGNIQYVNSKFNEVTGYSMDEVLNQNPRLLKSGLQTDDFYKNLWDTILSGNVWQGEIHNKKKNGRTLLGTCHYLSDGR